MSKQINWIHNGLDGVGYMLVGKNFEITKTRHNEYRLWDTTDMCNKGIFETIQECKDLADKLRAGGDIPMSKAITSNGADKILQEPTEHKGFCKDFQTIKEAGQPKIYTHKEHMQNMAGSLRCPYDHTDIRHAVWCEAHNILVCLIGKHIA